MMRFCFLRFCGSSLLLCMLMVTILLTGDACAQASTSTTIETGSRTISLFPEGDFSGSQVMVPFRAMTEALGGIWLDVPIGTEHKVAILNDKAFYIVPGMNVQVVLPLTGEVSVPSGSLDDYMDTLTRLLLDGTIPMGTIDFAMIDKNGDLYIPLDVFTSAFSLDATVSGRTIYIHSNFVYYQFPDANVTFKLSIPSKTYDGKPLVWAEDALQVFCNGAQVTDYLPLDYECAYTDMQLELQFEDGIPVNAGTYVLTIRTNPNDPKYSGVGYVSFAIFPAELTLKANDETITASSPLPTFSYEIDGIIPGETKKDALLEEPKISAQVVDGSRSGTYKIELSGGTNGKNYIIKDRLGGTLTILPGNQQETVLIRCIDQDTGLVIQEFQQQGRAETAIEISAPVLNGYTVFGQTKRSVVIKENAEVIFYYTSVSGDLGEDPSYNLGEDPSYNLGEDPSYNLGEDPSYNLGGDPSYDLDDDPSEENSEIHLAYITGYVDGSFRPQNNMKRSENAVMLYRLLVQNQVGAETVGAAWRFMDVHPNMWYGTAVSTLASKGIVNGYQDGSFRPNREISRAEFVVMALRYAEITPYVTTNRYFKDVPQTYWAADYIQTAAQLGLLSGYPDGTFRPEQYITRAEAVTILNKITGRAECMLTDETVKFSDVSINYWAYKDIVLAANGHWH